MVCRCEFVNIYISTVFVMSHDLRPNPEDDGQPENSWSSHPGWYLPDPSGELTSYPQFPGWTPPPHGCFPPGPAPRPSPPGADVQRQVEEAVQRPIPSMLPTALGLAASQSSSPRPIPPASSSAAIVSSRTDDISIAATSGATTTTVASCEPAPRASTGVHTSSTPASGTSEPSSVGGESVSLHSL